MTCAPWAERRQWGEPSVPSRTWAADGRRLESLKSLRGADSAEGWCPQRAQRGSAYSAVPRCGPLVAREVGMAEAAEER
jgi:hypothetical protein